MVVMRKDLRIPAREECTVRALLDRWAEDRPDDPFAVFWRGPTISFREMRERAMKVAAGLAVLGVRQGDSVVVWLPNGVRCLETWFGINWLGAVYVPINVAYRGGVLQHVLSNSAATVIVTHADLVGRLADIDRAAIRTAVVVGGTAPEIPGLDLLSETALDGDPAAVPTLDRPIEPWDL